MSDTANAAIVTGTGKRNSHSSDQMPDVKMGREGIDAPATSNRRGDAAHRKPYVSLDGLVFLLADLYMKVPQDIIEKVGLLYDCEKNKSACIAFNLVTWYTYVCKD